MTFTGKCLCGNVSYRCNEAPILTGHCHCEDCRRASGTGHSTHVVVQANALKITGTVKGYGHPADNGNIVTRFFCPNCGCAVHSVNETMPDIAMVRASSLDDPEIARPSMHVFTCRAASWDPIDRSLDCFDKLPPGGAERVEK